MKASSALAKRPRPLPITVDSEVRGGEPCFTGTRVPVSSLFVNLEGGVTLDEYLDAFPALSRAQAIAVLEFGRQAVLAHAKNSKLAGGALKRRVVEDRQSKADSLLRHMKEHSSNSGGRDWKRDDLYDRKVLR